jgi:hypothetical protein
MSIAIKMPAPLAHDGRGHALQVGWSRSATPVSAGDIMAEIETDKGDDGVRVIDEGVIAEISVPEGTEGVKVGTCSRPRSPREGGGIRRA